MTFGVYLFEPSSSCVRGMRNLVLSSPNFPSFAMHEATEHSFSLQPSYCHDIVLGPLKWLIRLPVSETSSILLKDTYCTKAMLSFFRVKLFADSSRARVSFLKWQR